jgi:hypothetical protein
MKLHPLIILGLAAAGCVSTRPSEWRGHRLQIRDGHFVLDGAPALIKGSFYEYHPAGRNPWDGPPPPDVFRRQMRELKAAGFNAIRWFNVTSDGFRICNEERMLLFVQFWIPGEGDFANPAFRASNLERLRGVVRMARGHECVAGYLVHNEPQVHTAASEAEVRPVMDHLLEIRDMVKREDPGALVSFDNWPSLARLDHSAWDFVAFNVYDWSPITTTPRAMGYRPYVEWLKRTVAPDKPLVLMEYGISAAPHDATGYGYGGVTEKQQAERSLAMLRDILAAGADGAVYTHYADQIWKSGSNAERDDNPEEWFGLFMQDLDGGPEMEGRWRPVFDALRDFHQLIVVEPAPCATVAGRQPLRIQSDTARTVSFRVDSGAWLRLKRSAGGWWTATLDTTKWADGLRHIEVEADGRISRDVWVVAANRQPDAYARDVRLSISSAEVRPGEPLVATVSVRRKNGSPVSGATVGWAVYEHRTWVFDPQEAKTGPDGTATLRATAPSEPGWLTLSAGVDVSDGPYRRRFGDLLTVRVRE